MIDCFALLEQPRRPWLESDELKRKFLALSAEFHPDRVHQAPPEQQAQAHRRYTDLNAAYQRLREPKERLLHLIELERGARPAQVQGIPAELMDLSLEVARLCRAADEFLVQKNRAVSPLLQVEMFERAQEWSERLMGLQKQINVRYEELLAQLKLLDTEWQGAQLPNSTVRTELLERVESLYRTFSFVGRWQSQMRERLVQLAF